MFSSFHIDQKPPSFGHFDYKKHLIECPNSLGANEISIIQLQRTIAQDGFIKNTLLNGRLALLNFITKLIEANLKVAESG
jgi:hypothetical protein